MSDAPAAWTPQLVRERIHECFATLRRSAAVASGPSQRVTYWPDAPNRAEEAYGYTKLVETDEDEARIAFARPSRSAIGRMEEVLGWIASWATHNACHAAGLPPDAVWVALKRAEGWAWRRIMHHRALTWAVPSVLHKARGTCPGGNSRDSLRKMEAQAYFYLVINLERAGVQVRLTEDDPAEVVRGSSPEPGAMPRAMTTVKPIANAEPCGTCSLFLVKTRQGPRMLCTKFNVVVGPLYRAYAPPGQPCWVPKAEEDAA